MRMAAPYAPSRSRRSRRRPADSSTETEANDRSAGRWSPEDTRAGSARRQPNRQPQSRSGPVSPAGAVDVAHLDAFQRRGVDQTGIDAHSLVGRIGQQRPMRDRAAVPAAMIPEARLAHILTDIAVELTFDAQFVRGEIDA